MVETTIARPEVKATPSAGRPGRTAAPRLRALDGLRLFAAAAVMIYHFTAASGAIWGGPTEATWPGVGNVTQYGYLGVNLFFIISGFVILMTAWGRTVDSFAASRVARLFPAYWVSVILTAGLLIFVSPAKHVGPVQALANLVMVHPAYQVDHVDGVYWTLWTELRFYLLIGVFLCLGITRRRIIAVCSVWPMLGALAHNQDQELLASLLVWEYAPYFAAGMMLYLIHRDGHSVLSWALVAFNGVLILKLAADFAAVMPKYTGRIPSTTVTLLLLVAAIALVALATSEPAQRLQWRWLTLAGALTYPLYLIHQYWGSWVINELHDDLGRQGALALAVSVSLLMAWTIHRLVERPLAPWLRYWVSTGLGQAAERDEAARSLRADTGRAARARV